MTVAAGKVWNLSVVKMASLGFFLLGMTSSLSANVWKQLRGAPLNCMHAFRVVRLHLGFGPPHFSGPAVIRCTRIGAKTKAGNSSLTSESHQVPFLWWVERLKWVNWSFFYIVSNVRLRGGAEGYICSLTCTHMHTYTGCGWLDLSGQGLLPRENLTVEHWDCCAWFWSLWFSPDLASKYTAASRNSTLSSGEARHGKFRRNKKDRGRKKEAGEIYVPIPVCGGVSFLNAFNTRRRGKSSLAEWSLVKVKESNAEQQ